MPFIKGRNELLPLIPVEDGRLHARVLQALQVANVKHVIVEDLRTGNQLGRVDLSYEPKQTETEHQATVIADLGALGFSG